MATQKVSLRNVRDFLYDIRLRWYDLGVELEIPCEELDRIKDANRDDHAACLREMIKVRLRFPDDPLTWSHIKEALSAKAVNELELAKQGM